jgi:asparagine synthase (glutamine-hydrolysing)
MCGITGYRSSARFDVSLQASMDAMRYRGPDSSGEHILNHDATFVGVGHVRLKVIDLDERASQPFLSQSGNSLVVFNGEIYNFESLKALLPEHDWKTTSDTEVVAELFDYFGKDVISKFNGIYSIAHVCLRTGALSLFRDPLGVKPLYYYAEKNEVFFASEVKALSKYPVNLEISREDLLESLHFGYVHEPNTGFRYIKKVPPGAVITFDKHSVKSDTFFFESDGVGFSEQKVKTALKRQSFSDVPIGTFFSGGVDSTVIASEVESDLLYINSRLDEDDNKEANLVNELSSQLERKLLVADLPKAGNLNEIVDIVDEVVKGVEDPISDLTYLVSKDLASLAKNEGFTVMLSGMGADELFGGYLRYYIVKYHWLFSTLFRGYLLLNSIKNGGHKHKLDRIRNYLDEKDSLKRYARLVGYFSSTELQKLTSTEAFNGSETRVFNRLRDLIPRNAKNSDFLSMRALEMKGFLSHNLTVADKSSMQSSVELRVPFLDLDVVNSWFGVKCEKSGVFSLGKKPLLNILRSKVPFKWSPFSKTGFNPPIALFFESVDRRNIDDVIFSTEMLQFFDKKGLEEVVDGCFSANAINYHKLWQLFFISRWLKHWHVKR